MPNANYVFTPEGIFMSTDKLYHHGIKGMRWGVRRTKAQLGYKTSTKKSRFGFSKKANKEKKKEAEEVEDIETKKKRILKSRSAAELYKNADLFTTSELQSAYTRLQLERNIASLSPKQVNKGKAFVDNAVKWGQSVNNAATTGINLYNNVAKVYNAFSENGRKNPKPIIGEKSGDKDKKNN